MRKITLYIQFLILLLVIQGSCRNEDLNPIPEPEYAPVATVEFTEDKNKSFYNLQDINSSAFEFILGGEDFGYPEAAVASIDVIISYNGKDKKLMQNYSELPATVNVSATQAAAAFGKVPADLKLGDTFTFSFIVRAKSGQVFELYNNNICNLIRIEGVCSVDAYVLNPAIAKTTVSLTENTFKKSAIAAGTTKYTFTLNKSDFATTNGISTVDVMLRRTPIGGTISPAILLTSVSSFPSNVSVTPEAAAAALGIATADINAGDVFTLYFKMNTSDGKSFTNYAAPASGVCGKTFPGNIIYPLHDSWVDPSASTAPPSTSMSGTCSLSFAVTN